MTEYTDSLSAPAEVARAPRQTESLWGWNQVAVAFLSGGLFQGLMVYCYSALMALVALDISATQAELMYPKMAMMAAGAVLAPFLGIMVDRSSIKWALTAGAVIFGAGLTVINTAETILQLALVFALFFGPLQCLLGPLTTSALVSRWFERRRGFAIGVSNVGISVGAFCLPFVIKHMSVDLGMAWDEIFPVLAVGVVVLMLPVILLLTIDKPDDFEQTAGARHAAGNALTTGVLLRDQGFWTLGLCVGIMYGLLVGILSNIVQMGMAKGMSLPDAMYSLSVLALGGFIGKLTVGYLSDRINNCLLLVIVLLVFALGLLPPVLIDSPNAIYLSAFIVGFSAISSLPLWHSLTARLFGVSNFARVIGLAQPIVFLGTFGGPYIVAKFYDLSGTFDYVLLGAAGALVAATVLVIGVRAKEKQVLAAIGS